MNQSDENEFSDPRARIKKCVVVVAVITLCAVIVGTVLLLGRTMDDYFTFEKNRADAEKQLAKLREDIAKLDEQKDRGLRAIEAEKARQRERLHGQYTNEAARIRTELSERRKESARVKSELDARRGELETAESLYVGVPAKLEEYRSATNRLAGVLAELRQQSETLTRLRIEASACAQERDEAVKRRDSLADEVEDFEKKIEDAKGRLKILSEQKDQAIRELTKENAGVDEKRRERTALTTEISKLSVRRAELLAKIEILAEQANPLKPETSVPEAEDSSEENSNETAEDEQ